MRVKKVEYISEYKLKLLFSNDEVKIIDFADKVKNAKGIFLPLKNQEYFKKVAVDDSHLSICWPNGADICPDVLYSMGKNIGINKKLKKPISQTQKITRRKKTNKV